MTTIEYLIIGLWKLCNFTAWLLVKSQKLLHPVFHAVSLRFLKSKQIKTRNSKNWDKPAWFNSHNVLIYGAVCSWTTISRKNTISSRCYPLSVSPTKWSNTFKSVFDHFVGLALKGLITSFLYFLSLTNKKHKQ